MNTKKNAIFLGFIILSLIIICSIWIIIAKSNADKGGVAYIYQDGDLIRTVSLDEESSFTIDGDNGESNTISVANKKIGITHANCPDKLCIKMGFTDSSLLPITCLPNHIVIEIKSSEDSTLDAIVH